MANTIVLADTNIISEMLRKSPDVQVMRWINSAKPIAISAVTIEEAHFGLAWQPNLNKMELLERLVQNLHAVYPVTASIAQRAGILRGRFRARGISRSAQDMLIAATAIEHQLIVATRNVRDFQGCGLRMVNPFDANSV